MLLKRFFGTTNVAAVQLDIESLLKVTQRVQSIDIGDKLSTTKTSSKNSKKTKQKPKTNIINASTLFEKYRDPLIKLPTAGELSQVNHFFNKTDVKFEWSALDFLQIPGEKLKHDKEAMLSKTMDNEHLDELVESNMMYDTADEHSTKKYRGKTGVPFELINGLPEVIFLGRSNVGKSTLLNSLTTESSQNKLNEFARASKRAGYTKTLNCFNLGNRLRIIDSPGYGARSTQTQGNIIMEYIQKRVELKRCYLLISMELGFCEQDLQLIDFLTHYGISYEIVFTKVDKVTSLADIEAKIQESGILSLAYAPSMIFVNSQTNKKYPKRMGIDQVRYSVLQGCGLTSSVKPTKTK